MIDISSMPASVDAEKSILGAILLNADSLDEARSALHDSDFSLDSHKRIFKGMCRLSDSGNAVDIVVLSQALTDSKEIQAVGGVAYLSSLTEGLPRRISIKEYVRITKEKSQLRRLIGICSDAVAASSDQAEKAIKIIGSLQDGIESILNDDADDDPAVTAYIADSLNKYHAERKLTEIPGMSYGIPKLDDATGQMRPGEVTVVGARSGVGKTSLMVQAAVANCMAGKGVHLFSLEMTRDQILRRIFSIVSGVTYKKISDPWLSNEHEAQLVTEAAARVAEWPLRIHDNSELHLSKIVAMARVSMRRHATRFIAVDYAQEVDAPGKDERAKVMATARGLAKLVKHENASLMLLSQFVKTGREFYNKAPVVGDLVESGKLENVAHTILLLHRWYEEDTNHLSTEAQIIIPKQRRGGTGMEPATYNKRSLSYEM